MYCPNCVSVLQISSEINFAESRSYRIANFAHLIDFRPQKLRKNSYKLRFGASKWVKKMAVFGPQKSPTLISHKI